MGVDRIHERENELVSIAFREFRKVPNLNLLADSVGDRLGVMSFYIADIHYNLIVSLLSDRFGIQVRGGCACAGTYGHFLLDVSYEKSKTITDKINAGDLSEKPGWVRVSLHPTMTDSEVLFIADALRQIQENHKVWGLDYSYNRQTNEFMHKSIISGESPVHSWFCL
jgi:selenocysteine lyase/cysteine desulfurase